MRQATYAVSAWLGALAGLAGMEHGFFELMQGESQPTGMFFRSMGAPCDPAKIWNACEPAMSILPGMTITGALSFVIGIAIVIWSLVLLKRGFGGWGLILLSVALLLFGGGFFPPIIGILGGVAGTQIHGPVKETSQAIFRYAAALWPWPLVVLVGWLLGQFAIGYFFNDLLKSVMGIGLGLILLCLPLSVFCGYARDITIRKA